MDGTRWILGAVAAAGIGLLAGCYPTACTDAMSEWCRVCETHGGWEEDVCECLEKNKLDRDSATQQFRTDDDAQMWCDELQASLRYVGDDTAKECADDRAMLGDWGNDYCDYFNSGGYWYWYW